MKSSLAPGANVKVCVNDRGDDDWEVKHGAGVRGAANERLRLVEERWQTDPYLRPDADWKPWVRCWVKLLTDSGSGDKSRVNDSGNDYGLKTCQSLTSSKTTSEIPLWSCVQSPAIGQSAATREA